MVYGRSKALSVAIESHIATLKLGEARLKAEPVQVKYNVGKPRFELPGATPVRPTKRAELMYVRPNGELGGVKYDTKELPMRLRLAWVLFYGQNDEVWIDAADGRVLGGVLHAGNKHWLRLRG